MELTLREEAMQFALEPTFDLSTRTGEDLVIVQGLICIEVFQKIEDSGHLRVTRLYKAAWRMTFPKKTPRRTRCITKSEPLGEYNEIERA